MGRLTMESGWDDLFTKCSEHLNSLQAIKLSPYYRVFEEEAAAWEERLNRIHVLFGTSIHVVGRGEADQQMSGLMFSDNGSISRESFLAVPISNTSFRSRVLDSRISTLNSSQ